MKIPKYIPWIGLSVYCIGSIIAIILRCNNILEQDFCLLIAIFSLLFPIVWMKYQEN